MKEFFMIFPEESKLYYIVWSLYEGLKLNL